jgi:hypothetical protein
MEHHIQRIDCTSILQASDLANIHVVKVIAHTYTYTQAQHICETPVPHDAGTSF